MKPLAFCITLLAFVFGTLALGLWATGEFVTEVYGREVQRPQYESHHVEVCEIETLTYAAAKAKYGKNGFANSMWNPYENSIVTIHYAYSLSYFTHNVQEVVLWIVDTKEYR